MNTRCVLSAISAVRAITAVNEPDAASLNDDGFGRKMRELKILEQTAQGAPAQSVHAQPMPRMTADSCELRGP